MIQDLVLYSNDLLNSN